MEFASDVTDKKKLPANCTCSLLSTPNTYDQRLRLQRACIKASTVNPYTVTSVTVSNGSTGYNQGDYLELSMGSGAVLPVQVSAVGSLGNVLTVVLFIVTTVSVIPTNPVASANLTTPGAVGATFTVNTESKTRTCCTCGS